jgi:hypothetical protein
MIQQNQTKNRHISASAKHSAAIYRVTAVKTWTLNVLLASPLSSAVSSIGRKVLLRKLHRLLPISLRFIANYEYTKGTLQLTLCRSFDLNIYYQIDN